MKRFALMTAAAAMSAGLAAAQDTEVVPATPQNLEPIPMQSEETIVSDGNVIQSDDAIVEGQVVDGHIVNGSVVPPAPVYHQHQGQTVYTQPTYQQRPVRRTVRRSSNRRGVFGRMMELERRKNAWLRRTFLNR